MREQRVYPDVLQLGDNGIQYKLSACCYGDGAHFISMSRDFNDSVLYDCNGMEDNAQYRKQNFTNFPLDHKGYRLTDAFFIRTDFTK